MDGDGYMCDDDDDDDDDDDHDDHDYDYDRDEFQCMLVDWYASQRFSSQVCNEVVRSMQAKLLVSDNTLSTHVRPRQHSDVPSKYSLAKRPRLSSIGSSFSAWKHL